MRRCWLLLAIAIVLVFGFASVASAVEASASGLGNAGCLGCHSVSSGGQAVSKVDFGVPGKVNYEKCRACHGTLPDLVPYAGAMVPIHYHDRYDCRDCHNGDDAFLFVQLKAPPVSGPTVQLRYGYFDKLTSLDATSGQLHAAHLKGNWVEETFGAAYPQCSSCHAVAACSACHDEPVAHQAHGGPQFPAVLSKQAIGTGVTLAPSTCTNPSCHAPGRAGTPEFTPTCGSCHPTKVQAHGYESVSHAASDSAVGGVACSACHSLDMGPEHSKSTSTSSGSGCGTCHPAPRDTLGDWNGSCVGGGCHTAGSAAPYHQSADQAHAIVPAGQACLSCHSGSDLASVHVSAKSSSGAASCLVCHTGNGAPASNDCTTCHFTFQDHYPISKHQSVSALNDCGGAGCHGTTDLLGVHQERDVAFGCDDCHASARQEVKDAIAIGLTGCADCHGTATHLDASEHTASLPASLACGSCHAGSSSAGMDVKAIHAAAPGGACGVCHQNSARVPDVTSKSTECASCHAAEKTDYHRTMAASHTSAQGECSGSGCHAIVDLAALHSRATTSVAGATYSGCAVCHRSSADQPTSSDCKSCHPGHGDLTAAHTAPGSSECIGCHKTTDVRALHSGAASGPCAVCHANADIPALPVNAACVNCHGSLAPIDPSHYPAPSHAAFDGSSSGRACSSCHYLGMKQEHAKVSSGSVDCVSCHLSKVDGLNGWNGQCSACHTTALHAAQSSKHVSAKTACGGTGCHATADVAVVHAKHPGGGCDLCHTGPGVVPGTTDCNASGCHPNTKGNHEAQHDTTGVVDEGCAGCHFTLLTTEHSKLGLTCATCHDSTVPAVAQAIASGNRSCAACHPAVNGKNRHAAQQTAEFVIGNSSGHRAYSSLSGMKSAFSVNGSSYTWGLPAASSFLKAGWTTNSVVTCNDCHSFSSTTAGPHGAAVTVNMDPAYPGDYTNAYLNDNGPSPSNLICAKCHTNFTRMNGVHSESDHYGSSDGKCVRCHSKVPHGWRLPRLLAYTSDPVQYSSTGLTGLRLASRTSSNWSENDCSTSCGEHSSSMSGRWPSLVNTMGTLKGAVVGPAGEALPAVVLTTDKGQTATADSLGRYSFGPLQTGTYQVKAVLPGYVTQTKSVTLTADQTLIADFTLVPTPPSSNVAKGKIATASSAYSSAYDAAKAFDGTAATFWRSSNTSSQWLRVDLGTAQSVSKFVIDWNGNYYARAYRIETSTDGTSWTSRYSFSSGSGAGGDAAVTLGAPVTARYVRLTCTSPYSSGYQVAEFEVWN